MKANYHTHTPRCHHASGTEEAYVRAAIEGGFDLIGFADHGPWPFRSGYVSHMRMTVDELPDYLRAIQDVKRRYAGQIGVLAGLEMEYFPRYHDHLLRMREQGVQYFILGQHFADSEEDTPYTRDECRTGDGVLRYAESVVNAIRTGLFAYVAHPDLFALRESAEVFDSVRLRAADMICQAAKEQGVPLEFNLLGIGDRLAGHDRGYPARPFWECAVRHGNDVILGVDAHDPAHLTDGRWEQGKAQAAALGCRMVDSLVIAE